MLPIDLPLTPMLARSEARLPRGMAYEPKWDGWRAILSRDEDDVRLWSRRGTDLTAYFPELVAAALDMLPVRCVLDGEIVIIAGQRLDYTKLASRHAALGKVQRLSAEYPASFVAFDLLAFGDVALLTHPWRERRALLRELYAGAQPPLLLSPVTSDYAVAQEWFEAFEGAGLDGVVAKSFEGPYLPGQRAMVKVKHRRTTDVVVGGFRYDRNSTAQNPQLGSLLLGLFDDAEVLHFVGICAGFPGSARRGLAEMLGELELPRAQAAGLHPWSPEQANNTGARIPEGVTRWSAPREEAHLIWPLLACEVEFDYLHDEVRFRSNADFQRWRPDRAPESCRFEQLTSAPRFDLSAVLARRMDTAEG